MNNPKGRRLCRCVATLLLVAVTVACTNSSRADIPSPTTPKKTRPETASTNPLPVIHVFVALADNVNQGIVPVSASLGNGDNADTNLYWGAAFGVRTFFSKNKDWELIYITQNPSAVVLERAVFRHRKSQLFLVADAYRGREISQSIGDFLEAAAGKPGEKIRAGQTEFSVSGSADVVAYVGHNGLMDFQLHSNPQRRDTRERRAIILACASKQYFSTPLQHTAGTPLLWTTNLMAPEAYVLSAAIDGWMKKESDEQIRSRAAAAYNKYQNCGLKAANALFATGW